MRKSEFIRLALDSRKEFLKYYIIAKYNGIAMVNLIEQLCYENGSNYIRFGYEIGAIENDEI